MWPNNMCNSWIRAVSVHGTTIAWSGDSRLISYGKGAGVDDNWVAEAVGDNKRSLGAARVVEFSPDGRYALVSRSVPPSDQAPRGAAYDILDLRDWSSTPVNAPVDGYVPPVWSPSGRYLAYWKQNVGGSAIIGPMAIYDVEARVAYDIGQFTSDEDPQWAPSTDRNVFHNIEIDRASGEIRELFPRPGAWDFTRSEFPRPGAVVGWSPDMRQVAVVEGSGFGEGPRRLVMLEPATGKRSVLDESADTLSHPSSPGYRGAWAPDSRYFAFGVIRESDARTATDWYMYDAATSSVKTIDQGALFFVSFSPDSRYLLFARGVGDSASDPPLAYPLIVANADGSNPRTVAEGIPIADPIGAAWRGWRPDGD